MNLISTFLMVRSVMKANGQMAVPSQILFFFFELELLNHWTLSVVSQSIKAPVKMLAFWETVCTMVDLQFHLIHVCFYSKCNVARTFGHWSYFCKMELCVHKATQYNTAFQWEREFARASLVLSQITCYMINLLSDSF